MQGPDVPGDGSEDGSSDSVEMNAWAKQETAVNPLDDVIEKWRNECKVVSFGIVLQF